MKTKPTHTVKLRTVQSGIEAELRSMIRVNQLDAPATGEYRKNPTFTARQSDIKYRQALKNALTVVRAQFESYR